jgi:hypothetical protein
MKKFIVLTVTHLATIVLGFVAGNYMLPIIVEPKPPSVSQLKTVSTNARFTTQFKKNLKGSDFLHWGTGKVSITDKQLAFEGELAPGPDYKLYLAPEYVETEAAFLKIKGHSLKVADVRSFHGFIVDLPPNVDLTKFNTVVIWCETFKQFISAGRYRPGN